MLVLLDTTAIMNDPLLSGAAWRVIAHGASGWGLEVLVPEVVVIEASAGYVRRIEEARTGLDRWGQKHAGVLGLSPENSR
jgi:hypothetical protein